MKVEYRPRGAPSPNTGGGECWQELVDPERPEFADFVSQPFRLAPTPSIQFVKPPPRAAFSSALFFCLGALVCFVETRGCVVKKCHPAQEVCKPTAGVLQKCWQALAVHDTCH